MYIYIYIYIFIYIIWRIYILYIYNMENLVTERHEVGYVVRGGDDEK